jgi:hypothetical protein
MPPSPASLESLIVTLKNQGEYSDKRIEAAESLMTEVMRDTSETHDLRYEVASVLSRAKNQRIAHRAERMLVYLDWESDDRPDKGTWEG